MTAMISSTRFRWSITNCCALLSFLGGSIFGYVLIGISSAALTLWRCQYGLADRNRPNEWAIGALFAVINIGGLPYGLFAGHVMEYLGRRKTIGYGASIIFVGTFLSGVAPTYSGQAIARIGTGVGSGMISSSIPVYISEMAPYTRRGSLQALYQLAVTLMILFGNVLGYFLLGPNRDLPPSAYCPLVGDDAVYGKNFLLLLPGMALSLMVMGAAALIIPESRSWSGYVGTPEDELLDDELEAENLRLAKKTPKAYNDTEAENDVPTTDIPRSFIGLLHCPQSLVAAFAIALAQQATGINAVMFYAPKFLAMGGVQLKMLGSVAVMLWNFLATLIAMVLVDRVGRRTLLLPTLFIMAISLLSMGPMYALIGAKYLSSFWCFVPLFAFVTGFAIGPGTLFGVILNEIFPEEVLPFGAPLVGTSSGLFALCVTFLFPPLELEFGTGVFGFFGVISAILWVYLLVTLPETKGCSKKEITRKVTEGSWLQGLYEN